MGNFFGPYQIAPGGGSSAPTILSTSSSTYSIPATTTNAIVLANTSSNAINVTLPTPTAGSEITIKDSGNNAQTNNLTITHNASENIDGASTLVITFNYGFVTLGSDGTNWFVIARSSNISSWTSYSLTIGATSSAPNYGTATVNKAYWRRNGTDMEISYDLTAPGSSGGSGTYLFPLPSGFTINTTDRDTVTSNGNAGICGAAGALVSGLVAGGYMCIYNSSNLNMVIGDSSVATAYVSSTLFNTSSAISYSFRVSIPISGWGVY